MKFSILNFVNSYWNIYIYFFSTLISYSILLPVYFIANILVFYGKFLSVQYSFGLKSCFHSNFKLAIIKVSLG